MDAVGRLGSYISKSVVTVSGPFHPFGGAVDIIVVEQPDGTYKSSPWYVKFGKFQGVLKAHEKFVTINVNGIDMDFNMYLNHRGEAYFLHECNVEDATESWDRAQLAVDLLELKWSTNLESRSRRRRKNVVSKDLPLDLLELTGEPALEINYQSQTFTSKAPLDIDGDYISEKYKICHVQKLETESVSPTIDDCVSASSAEVLAFSQFDHLQKPVAQSLLFSILQSEISEEEQLLFGHFDNFSVDEGRIIEYLSQKDEELQRENEFPEASFHEYGLHSGNLKEMHTNQIDPKNEIVRSKSMDSSTRSRKMWPFPNRSDNIELQQVVAISSVSSDADSNLKSPKGADVPTVKVGKKKTRALTPTSEQLGTLHLKEGKNLVTFIFSTPMLGRQQVDARIYLWRWDTRIAISDVDGTITRSDVLGQFMPWVGVDWTHTGVTHLFTAIKENGYQLLFLSARAISQSYLTRQFLFNIKQDGKSLPDGPVIISPDGLFPSLFREVVRRAPHEFKIGCLEDIKALFPANTNPFYAGFGNRDTDELSYLKVGIPLGKIFLINPKGEIVVNRHINNKSYTSLHGLVNDVFPPTSSSEQEDFNSWNFWKLPPHFL